MSAVADRKSELDDLGVDVLAVSVDSVFGHKIWDEIELVKMTEDGIPFPLLSDAGGNLGRVYGVYDEGLGVDIRGRFLIDPDGVIQAAEIMTPPVGRHIEETLRQVRAFQTVRASGGAEACPAGWQPGDETLKVGPDLAGHVWEVWQPEGRR